MKKTVLVADKNGQLGNRLFLFAHFISNAIENDYKLYFPGFDEYSIYFECASKNRYKNLPIRSRIGNNFFNELYLKLLRFFVAIVFRTKPVSKWLRIIRLYHTNDLLIDSYGFYNIEVEPDYQKRERFFILQGWNFRSPESVKRQQNIVRELFHLKPEWKNKVDNFIAASRENYDMLVAVHVRWGDYRTYSNGIYFYEINTYRNFMLQVKELFPGKKINFVICSNENVKFDEIDGAGITYSQQHFIEDLYSLAGCDFIIGPPSTFSQWASYYGNKPLRILRDATTPIKKLDEFFVSPL